MGKANAFRAVRPAFKHVVENENGLHVGIGHDGALYSSSDGEYWTRRSPEGLFSSLGYGNGTFVAVGKGIVSSNDGVKWTRGQATPRVSPPSRVDLKLLN
jgi:hypothetical protein